MQEASYSRIQHLFIVYVCSLKFCLIRNNAFSVMHACNSILVFKVLLKKAFICWCLVDVHLMSHVHLVKKPFETALYCVERLMRFKMCPQPLFRSYASSVTRQFPFYLIFQLVCFICLILAVRLTSCLST